MERVKEDKEQVFKRSVAAVSAKYDADILVCSTNLFSPADNRFVSLIQKRKRKRRNLLLVLTTPGGSADVAYRITRSIQHHYNTLRDQSAGNGKFYLYVPRYCKSAGTIIALGADAIFMSELAELGPIDVQLRKEDEVGDWTSGLIATEAMEALQQNATSLFIKLFKNMRFPEDTRFSTRLSTDIATRVAIGLLQPVYAQIDPMRLGEIERFVRIAVEYAERLATSNVREDTIVKLVVGYPSHSFIIDRWEAEQLFKNVEPPSEELELIGRMAFAEGQRVLSDEGAKPIMRFENEELLDVTEEQDSEPLQADGESGSRAPAAERENITVPGASCETTVSVANGAHSAE